MAVASAKSEEIAKLLNISGTDRDEITLLLEQYLIEDGYIFNNLVKSDYNNNDMDSNSSYESSNESSPGL